MGVNWRKNSLLLAVLLLISYRAMAGERYEFYTGIRQLAMGGAGIAIANDETAILINPAGLGKLRDPFFTIVDPELHMGEDTAGYYPNFDFKLELADLLQKIKDHPNSHYHLKGQVFPSFIVPNFGMGAFAKWEINGDYDSANDEVLLNYINDLTAVVGYTLRFFDGRVKFGFAARYINRTEIKDTNPIPGTTTAVEVKQIASNGGAVAGDVGLILTAPWATLPTLSVVVRDAGDTAFELGSGYAEGTGVAPDKIKQSIDGAIAFFPIFSKNSRMTFTAEMKDITSENQDDLDDINRRLHAGVEFNFGDIFFLRGGYNQRYWTGGIEFQMMKFQFQAASYGEEIGTPTTPREDRRYIGKFAFRF